MGLFGLFYTSFCLGGALVNSMKNNIEDEEAKKTRYNEEYNTYINHNGKMVDRKTGHIMITYRLKDRTYLKDTKTGRTRDITNERYQRLVKHFQDNPNPNVTHIKCLDKGFYDVEGDRYMDLKTGIKYVARRITYCGEDDFACRTLYCLMSTKKGKYIRLTDESRETLMGVCEEYKYDYNKEMEKWNKLLQEENESRKNIKKDDSFYNSGYYFSERKHNHDSELVREYRIQIGLWY